MKKILSIIAILGLTLGFAVVVFASSNFGDTNIESTNNSLAANLMYCSKGTPVSSGTVTSASIYEEFVTSPSNVKIVITDSGHNIITNGISPSFQPLASSYQWDTINYISQPTVVGGNLYYICLITDASSQYQLKGTTLTNNGWFDNSNSYTSPSSPTDGNAQDFQFSLYATYTPSGGSTANVSVMQVSGQVIIRGQIKI